MKNSWQTKKLGETCDISSGNSAPQKEEFFKNGTHYFFRTSDVGNIHIGIIFESRDKLNDKGIKNLTLFKKNTILFPKSGASTFLNHRVILGSNGYVSSHLATIKAKEETLIDKFLFYFLILIDAKTLVQDQNYPSLQIKSIQNININFPTILEQKRIVKILDETFEKLEKVKENTKKNLQNSKELFESYLNNIFSNPKKDWEEKTLGDIGKPSMCKRILKNQTSSSGEIPFYKIGTFGKEPNSFISKEIYNEFRTKYSFPKKGDILVSASGTIGRHVRYDGKPAFFQDSNIVWIDNDEKQVLNDYLYIYYEFCNWQPSKGATIARLYNNNFTSMKIVFPRSMAEQKVIIKKIDGLLEKIKRLEGIYKNKLEDIEELKKSILHKAFNGEL